MLIFVERLSIDLTPIMCASDSSFAGVVRSES